MDRIITWPNAITVGRMFFGIGGVYIALLPGYFLPGIFIFFVLGLVPDFLDGWVARAYNQKTRIGEFIDPLADKILFYLAVITLFSQYAWWFGVGMLFACDIISTIIHFYKKGGAVRTGKWKFGLQCAALVIFTGSALFNKELALLANMTIFFALCCAMHSLYHRIKG